MYHEIYGKYYQIIKELLNGGTKTEKEINDYIIKNGFDESIMYLNTETLVNDYQLFKEKNGLYYPVTKNPIPNIVTFEQLEWLNNVLDAKFIKLFMGEELIQNTKAQLTIEQTYDLNKYQYLHQDIDMDKMTTKNIHIYRSINGAIKEQKDLLVSFVSSKDFKTFKKITPFKFEYSMQDGKIRLICLEHKRNGKKRLIRIKISSILYWKIIDRQEMIDFNYYLEKEKILKPLVIEVYPLLNGIERVFIELSSYKREAYFDHERNVSVMSIYYEPSDELDLVIKLLSFGKVVKIISDGFIKDEVIRRLKAQQKLFRN